MSKRTWMILLDIVLFVVMVALIAPAATGIPLHEWGGTVLILGIIPHLLSSWPWIRRNTAEAFRNKNLRQRFIYLINAVFFLFVILAIFTGLMISEVCFPAWGRHPSTSNNWHGLHEFFSNGLIVLIALHLALNWTILTGYFRKGSGGNGKKYSFPSMSSILKTTGRTILILSVAVLFCVAIYYFIEATTILNLDAEEGKEASGEGLLEGLGKLFGSLGGILLMAYISHRWLKIRL